MRKLKSQYSIQMGCDPEFFFSKNNNIIGAEKILPEKGIQTDRGNIIIDGIQAELNPKPASCRQILASNISNAFLNIKKITENKDLNVDFAQMVTITEDEMLSLSPNSQKFGCSPSRNAYHKKITLQVKDASQYMFRSAGGHIHLGANSKTKEFKLLRDTKRIIPMLDLLVGNTSVLMDRHPGNIERRKNYGRAGEFRTPEHGLEYRTLSNFWLQSYPLMSFVFGMTRYAFNICANNLDGYFRRGIKMKTVEEAINTNNFDLAREIFSKVEKKMIAIEPKSKTSPISNFWIPLTEKRLPAFHHFISKDLSSWFPEDPMTHWIRYSSGNNVRDFGWENFLDQIVTNDMQHLKTQNNAK